MVAERGTTRSASASATTAQDENENENEKRHEQRNDKDASVTRRDWHNTRAAVPASIRSKTAVTVIAHRQTAVSVMLCSYIFACVD